MSDKNFDDIKQFMDLFEDLEDFKKRYLVHHPGKEDALIALFNDTRRNADYWELTKKLKSIDSLCLNRLYNENNDLTIKELLDEIKKYDLTKYKRIIIKLNNADYEDLDKLFDLGIDIDVLVKGDIGHCSLREFKAMRNFFKDFKQRYVTYNLSELEKITLAYDYVKFFLFNIEENDRLTDSRSIARCIATGNIVCEGFSRIFCQLLKEMGIHSNMVYIAPNATSTHGHVRVILRVDDDKYNVHDNFVLDPTFDAAKNTKLVSNTNGKEYYKSEKFIKQNEIVLKELLSDCRYLFFMIPIEEFRKYFPNDQIEKICKYPSGEKIVLNDDLKLIFNYNDEQPRNNVILTYFPDLLRKTKKVEGYNDEQIEQFIDDAIGILKQFRFGIWDKYANKDKNPR